MSYPKCWSKRSRWPSHTVLAVLTGLLLSGPVTTAMGQPGHPEAQSAVQAPATTPASTFTPEQAQAMDMANKADMQPTGPATATDSATQKPVLAAAPDTAPRKVESAVLSPEPIPVPKAVKEESNTWKWILGIAVGLFLGFFLARILGEKQPVIPAVEDVDALSRRHRHQRGQGNSPASNVEKKISKELNPDFIQAPMRQAGAIPPPAREAPPASTPPPARPRPSSPPTSKSNKPVRPMSEKTSPAPAAPTPPVTAAPTPQPPSIDELIDAGAGAATGASAPAAAQPAAPAGPVQFYAPAPDVPSIEHRKLSPNPLPQMPILVKLAQPDATKAEFSFSPQADQSRIIGNGVRELKEFFAFELPPTEQFTTIKNLTPGKLEKRDDTWHVVQKASIALS